MMGKKFAQLSFAILRRCSNFALRSQQLCALVLERRTACPSRATQAGADHETPAELRLVFEQFKMAGASCHEHKDHVLRLWPENEISRSAIGSREREAAAPMPSCIMSISLRAIEPRSHPALLKEMSAGLVLKKICHSNQLLTSSRFAAIPVSFFSIRGPPFNSFTPS